MHCDSQPLRLKVYLVIMKKTLYPLLTACLIVGLTCSCAAQVEPWERGNLAKPHMQTAPFPGRSMIRSHVFESKEASQGGSGTVGGGCGCN